jgi:GNAT superfamily N-acetyltransferase
MTSKATVRDAVMSDLPALLPLLDQLREKSSRPERPGEELTWRHERALAEILGSPHLTILVAEVNGTIQGTCALAFLPNINHNAMPYCVLENMVVDQSARGAGLGRALVDHAVELARKKGCYKLSLTSNLQREEAHRFYESAGLTHSHKGFTIYLD